MSIAPAHPRTRERARTSMLRAARVRRRRRDGWPEHLALLPTPPRGTGQRIDIPAGHPGALSWDLTPWELDDAAWYVTTVHAHELSCEQVAQLMGISDTRVNQIEIVALRKLRRGLQRLMAQHADFLPDAELTPEFIRGIFEMHDRRRRAVLYDRWDTEQQDAAPRSR